MNDRIWFNTAQAADHVGKHPSTILKALESDELDGHQRKAGGRWSIHRDCLDAWAGGTRCPREHSKAGAA